MAVPKRKTSPSRRNQRRAHDAIMGKNIVENSTTGEKHRPHNVSPDGFYRDRQVTTQKVNY